MSYKKLTLSTYILFVFSLLISGCATSKYAASDKEYKRMAKEFSKVIKAMPPVNQHIDSLQTMGLQSIRFHGRYCKHEYA